MFKIHKQMSCFWCGIGVVKRLKQLNDEHRKMLRDLELGSRLQVGIRSYKYALKNYITNLAINHCNICLYFLITLSLILHKWETDFQCPITTFQV